MISAWGELEAIFGSRPEIKAFLAFWDDSDNNARRRLLRDHRKSKVTDKHEQYLRFGVDYLLGYYAILEIASLIEYSDTHLPESTIARAESILKEPNMRKFYEVYYPVQLPQLLRLRLSKAWIRSVPSDDDDITLFRRFLGFVSRNRTNEPLELLMNFLDGFSSKEPGGNNLSIDSVAAAFADPEGLMASMLSDPGQQSKRDRVVAGLREFFEFAYEFDGLLKQTRRGLFQGEMWLFYDYYFRALGQQLGQQLDEAATQIRVTNSVRPDVESLRAQEVFTEYWAAITRLRSGEYAESLYAEIKKSVPGITFAKDATSKTTSGAGKKPRRSTTKS